MASGARRRSLCGLSAGGDGRRGFFLFDDRAYIPIVYFAVGGTPAERFERAAAGGPAVPSYHSPLFEIAPEPAVRSGVTATVIAPREFMPANK